MPSLTQTIEAGAALYRELERQLVAELPALAGRDPKGIAAANDRQEVVLDEIARWEADAVRRFGPREDGAPPTATFKSLVAALCAAERPAAEKALASLSSAARAARHQAAVSHIVVERGLEAVGRTIDVLTGTRTGTTYTAGGGVSRTGRRGLIERAG